jgi:hypothetical protein
MISWVNFWIGKTNPCGRQFMNAQLSTTDTRTTDRTAEQSQAMADIMQAERDAQQLVRELFEAHREIARLKRELRLLAEDRTTLIP